MAVVVGTPQQSQPYFVPEKRMITKVSKAAFGLGGGIAIVMAIAQSASIAQTCTVGSLPCSPPGPSFYPSGDSRVNPCLGPPSFRIYELVCEHRDGNPQAANFGAPNAANLGLQRPAWNICQPGEATIDSPMCGEAWGKLVNGTKVRLGMGCHLPSYSDGGCVPPTP